MKPYLLMSLALITVASVSAQPEIRPAVAGDPAIGDEYLSLNDDPLSIERVIERYLNGAGIKASTATGNNGATHFVLVGFTGLKGLPNVQYSITALPPLADGENPKTQLIGITFATNFRVDQPNESVEATITAANKVGNCAWFLDAGEIRCRSWLYIPNSRSPIPTESLRQKIRLINGDWLRLSPQILTASR